MLVLLTFYYSSMDNPSEGLKIHTLQGALHIYINQKWLPKKKNWQCLQKEKKNISQNFEEIGMVKLCITFSLICQLNGHKFLFFLCMEQMPHLNATSIKGKKKMEADNKNYSSNISIQLTFFLKHLHCCLQCFCSFVRTEVMLAEILLHLSIHYPGLVIILIYPWWNSTDYLQL